MSHNFLLKVKVFSYLMVHVLQIIVHKTKRDVIVSLLHWIPQSFRVRLCKHAQVTVVDEHSNCETRGLYLDQRPVALQFMYQCFLSRVISSKFILTVSNTRYNHEDTVKRV